VYRYVRALFDSYQTTTTTSSSGTGVFSHRDIYDEQLFFFRPVLGAYIEVSEHSRFCAGFSLQYHTEIPGAGSGGFETHKKPFNGRGCEKDASGVSCQQESRYVKMNDGDHAGVLRRGMHI
jgi:hypothetical protein